LRRLRLPSRAALRTTSEGEEAMMAATLDARFWLGFASASGVGFWEGTGGVQRKARTVQGIGVWRVCICVARNVERNRGGEMKNEFDSFPVLRASLTAALYFDALYFATITL
jgi:hypothetical protein